MIHEFIKEYKLLFLFILFILVLTMAPSIVPAFFVKPGYAWTTLNNFNYMVSDSYYYASGVREVISGNVFIKTPDNLLSCDTARIVPYWLAAIPFLFFGFNIAYPLSISLCVVTTFSLMYFIYKKIEVNTYSSLIFSFIALYFVEFWSHLPFSGFFPVSEFTNYIFSGIKNHLKLLIFLRDYDFNVNYRYVNCCAANTLLFSNIILALRFVIKASWINSALLFISALTMFFTYPSHTVISAIFMLSCFIYLFLEKDFNKIYILLAMGVSLIIFLFSFNYLTFIENTYYQSYILKSVHNAFNTGVVLKPISVNLVLHAIVNRYSITYLAFYYCFRDKVYGKLFLIFFFGLMVLASAVSFVDSSMIATRFTISGADMPWFFGLVFTLGTMIQKGVACISSHKLQKMLLIAISSLFITLPTIGFVYSTYSNIINGSCYQSASQAETIRWAADQLKKNQVIAALNFSDAHFLTYTGQYINFISYLDVQKITPEENLLRYIAVAKLCHMTHEEFGLLIKDSIKDSIELRKRMDVALRPLPNCPYQNPTEFQSAQFLTMLMIYPMIHNVWGIDISMGEQELRSLTRNEEFNKKVMDTFDELDSASYLSKHPIDYVLVSTELFGQVIMRMKLMYPVVFENKHGAIFKISKA